MPDVLIDARAAARPELGGVERWARELVARLPALAPERYAVAAPPPSLVHRAGHAWEQVVLPARAARARAALVLGPANLAPVAWPRNVVVLHDAAALRHPAWYSRAFVAWQRALLPTITRRAAQVITDSDFSRRELAELLGVDAVVVPGGVGNAFGPDVDPEPARRAFGLGRPYVFTLGSRTSRKNLGALSVAAERLGRAGIEVVAAGGDRPQFRPEGAVAGVRSLGAVPDGLLPGLYAGAEAFVFPSRYEGFGLPCLEAMASGTPVVASDAGSLAEVCGPAAMLVHPDDAEGFAAALERILGDPEHWIAAGTARAAAFTWAETAKRTDAVVTELLATVTRL